jgi:hypothetical protein
MSGHRSAVPQCAAYDLSHVTRNWCSQRIKINKVNFRKKEIKIKGRILMGEHEKDGEKEVSEKR